MGGLAKGHPDEADIAGAVAFYKEITEENSAGMTGCTERSKQAVRSDYDGMRSRAARQKWRQI